MDKAVAYIDLLGFSNFVRQSLPDAMMAITNFNTIISELIFEKKVHPSSGYIPCLQGLAMRSSIEAVDDFLSFSDSVFLTSQRCCDFVKQLGSFVRRSFLIEANYYMHPIDPTDPTKIEIPNLFGGPSQETHVPPTLFRGGLSFGEVQNMTPTGIVSGQEVQMNTIAGIAVVNAVGLEGEVKGPRLVMDESLYSQLDADAKQYCRKLPENT